MNIQKTNLLSLNNKFKMKDNQPAPVATPTIEGTETNDGMKALTLLGQQNYMNNVAFQGGMMKKLAPYAAALLMGGATLAMTSCSNDTERIVIPESHMRGDSTVVNVTVITNIDMSMMNAYLQQLVDQGKITNAELIALRADLNAWKAMYESDRNKWFEFMTNLYNRLDSMGDNQDVIITLLTSTGMSVEEIKAFLADLKAQGLSNGEIMEKILEKLGAIDQKLGNIVDILNSIDNKTGALLNTAKDIKENGDLSLGQLYLLTAQGESTLEVLNKMNEKQTAILNATKTLDKNMQNGFSAVTAAVARVGITAEEIKAILIKQGWTQEQIAKASVGAILAAIQNNTNATYGLYAQLQTIIENMKNGQFNPEELMKQIESIIKLLENIDANVSQLLDVAKQTLAELRAFRSEQAANMKTLINGQKINADKLNVLIDLNKQEAESLNNLEISANTLIAKVDEIKEQGFGIDYDKLKAIADELGLNINNANKAMFEQALQEYLKAHKEDNALLQAIYDRLGTLLGTTINKDDLNAAIQKVVVAINTGSDKLSDRIDELKAQLDKIIAQLQAIYDKMNEFAGAANNKWNKIEAYLGNVIALLTEGNATTAELLVQFKLARTFIEKMQADLEKLEAAAEQIKDDEAKQVVLQTEIKELLENLNIDPSKYETIKELLEACKEKLAIIAEKEWKCECHCQGGGNNEQIIEEAQNITG